MDNHRRTPSGRASHLAFWGAPLAILLAFAALLAAPLPALAASTINVNTTADENGAGAGCSLREAFKTADDNVNFGGCTGGGGGVPFTINVPAGTYTITVDELKIGDATNTNTSIVGAGAGVTIIQQTLTNRRVIDLNPLLAANVSVSISGATITGGRDPSDNFGGAGIIGGGPGNTLSLSNCTITGNSNNAGLTPKGGGIEFAGGGVLNINNCTISNNTAGTSASNLGVGGGVDYQLLNLAGAAGQGGLSITNTTFSNNVAGAANSGAGGAVRVAATTTQAPSGLTISNNTFTGNQANAASNGLGGAIVNASSNPVTINFNRFFNNTATGGATGLYKVIGSGSSTNATENWWGCNAGPGNAGCDSIGGETANITAAPRLVLSHAPAAGALLLNAATTLTASFLTDSNGAAVSTANLSRLIGQSITFNNASRGTLSAVQTTIQGNGTATATFTAGSTSAACGAGGANAVFDNQTLPATITVQCADLTATTVNNVAGSVIVGQGWTWTTTVANPGNAAANYSVGQTVFSANLPNSASISYGSPTSSNPSIACSINGSEDLICTASAAVSLAPAASFTVSFSAVASVIGSYATPRAGGACAVDPSNLVVESNEANNACSNTVSVSKATTATTITSDTPDPSVTGQSVTVNYSVAVNAPGAGTPTGNVTVSDGTQSCTGTVAAGTCSITFTSSGAKTLTATYAGDTNFNGGTSAGVAHTVNKADTTTTITSDTPDPSTTGQAVTINFSVTVNSPGAGTPTGNVTVSDGIDSCTATAASGICNITLTTAGARTLTATYAGDANYNTSTSAGVAHTVISPVTTTTITADTPDPSVVGQAVTINYTVTATGGTPTGNVTVSDGTQSCTGTVAAGTCSITFTSAGAKSLTATYAGDGTFTTSTSAAAAHTVNKADTTTTITSDTPDPSTTGQAVTVNFSVTASPPGAGTPTGNVTVSDGIDSCTATAASGICNITLTTAGARTLTATYAGDANFNTSTSAGVPHTVTIPDTTPPDVTINQAAGQADPTSASPIHFTAVFNEPVTGFASTDVSLSGAASATSVVVTEIAPNDGTTYDVAVSGMTTSGTVIATIAAGGAQDAAGNPNTASTSTDNTVTFVAAAPDLTIAKTHTGNFTQGQIGAQYTITVSNGGTGPSSGTVTVVDTLPTGLTATAISGTGWNCVLGTLTCTRSDALAAISSYPNIILTVDVAGNAPLSVTNTATVSGGGDSDTGNNSADDLTVISAPVNTDTTTTITADTPDPSVVGQAVTVQYSVTPNAGSGTPTGNVTVSDGTLSCTATVAAGQCSLTFTSAGAKTLTATYAGGGSFNGSTSAGEPHMVNKADTTTTITSDAPDPSIMNQPVIVQYQVSVNAPGAGTPTGNVTVSDGTLSCTATVAAGQCSLTFTSAGPKTLTATYAGDDNFNTSTSAGETHTVYLPLIVNMTVTKSHIGNFTQGQAGAQYTITASNTGSGPSSGTVTVVDTLPAGLTATAISGTGWSCTLATLTCTRSDALAAGSSYPNILVTVNVAGNAPSSITNTATVAGGGDQSTNDNTASDPTIVTASISSAQLIADPCFSGKSALLVSGTAGNDTIKLSAANGGKVTVTINGANLGTFKPTGLIIVLGQAGNDSITVDDAILQPRILYGNDGNDTIKDGFGLGIIVGGAGDDTLSSKTSRDILIGGTGADKLTGSLVDDILIAGSTSYDDATAANQKALCSIYAEWSNLIRSYQTRIDHLTGVAGGGLNGTNLLKPGQTVFDDTSKDTLTGGTGQDWFLLNKTGAGTLDTSDRNGSEIATDL